MIDDMPRGTYRYLYKQISRHGQTTWYVRKRGQTKIRLWAEYDSDDFWEEYGAAVAQMNKGAKVRLAAPRGTLSWLWDRYRESMAWAALSPATKRQRENIMLHVLEKSGDVPYIRITGAEIEAGKDRRRETPAQARNFLDAMRGLFRWAKTAGHVKADPTAGVANPPRPRTKGFQAWTDEDVAAYERHWPKGTKQWVWLRVLLYTGLRRSDAVMLGRQHVRDGVLSMRTQKTGTDVHQVIAPELQEALDDPAAGELTIIINEYGRPYVKEAFGNLFSAAARAAGVTKSAHGLRKLWATKWAERGASEAELEAMAGWQRGSMAALYTKNARRKALAIEAARRLGTSVDRNCDPPKMASDPPAKKIQ